MAEADHALSLLRQESLLIEEVLVALKLCPSGTSLDDHARAAIKDALSLLQDKETSIAQVDEALARHQELHKQLEKLRERAEAERRRVQECAKKLTAAEAALAGPLETAMRLLQAGTKAEEAEVEVSDVVNYAQRISGITSAPAYWKPGMAMVGFAPPAPRPEMMRAGALSAFASETSTSLPAEKMLKMALDLDRPSDHTPTASSNGDGGVGHVNEGGLRNLKERNINANSDALDEAEDRKEDESRRRPPRRDNPMVAGFARDEAIERPKILLDLDDLESDDDSGDDSSS